MELVQRWSLVGGWRHALVVKRGPRWIHFIPMDITPYGLDVKKRPPSDERNMRSVANYPLDKAIRRFLEAGTRVGITQRARNYLEGNNQGDEDMATKSKKTKGKATQRPDKMLPRPTKSNGKTGAAVKAAKSRVESKANGKKRKASMSQKIREACGPLFTNGKKPERQALIAACVKAGMKAEVLSHHSVNSVHTLIKRIA